MSELFRIFALKLLDTAIGSLKSILMIKGKAFGSAVAATASYWFFITLMKQLMTTNSTGEILATLAAVFLGQYLTQMLSDKFEKDSVWKITITPESMDDGLIIADKLRKDNVPVTTDFVYNKSMTRVLEITAFSKNKACSALVQSVIEKYDVKLAIIEIKNRL
jgi:hypothetical protein